MNKSNFYLIWVVMLLLLQSPFLNAQMKVFTDQPDATYVAGEQMNFIFEGAGNGTATYKIRHDRAQSPVDAITEGTIQVFGGRGQISFTLTEPGFVYCDVTLNGQSGTAPAAFSPFDIDEYEADPDDFDEFWNGWKSKLAAVPMNPVVTPLFPDPNAQTKDFRINLGHIDGRRVYGYLSIPPGDGPFPAIITHSSFGGNANFCIPRPEICLEVGAISLSIWMHNTEPDVEDFNAYKPEIWDDEQRIYYRYGVLGLVRAMDFIESLPDYNGKDLGLFGVSEGGGLSILAAGIDDRPTMVGASIFALSEHSGFKYERASSFPYFLVRSITVWPPEPDERVVQASKYFDAMRAAKRYKGPVYTTTNYMDEVVMSATNFSTFNQFRGPATIVQKTDGVHLNPDEFFFGKFDFMRKHLNQGGKTGYHAEAGNDIYDAVNTVTLTGKTELDGIENTSIPIVWELVSGPGQVAFSNKTARQTTMSFTEPGEYVVRLRATDQTPLSTTNAFFTFTDHVIVSTESGADVCNGMGGDVDGDGVCAEDDCDDNNANISKPGDTCDDGNANTTNDVIQADCSCLGVPVSACAAAGGDADGDGVCAEDDCDDNNADISNPGDACDDGNPLTANDVIQADCSCLGTAGVPCTTAGGDEDGDGICAQFDCDDNNPDISVRGDACDDGDANTINDVIQEDCSCSGTTTTTSGCGVTWTVNGLNIKIENLNYPIRAIKLFNSAFSEVFVCNDWVANPCGTTVSIDVPLTGSYLLQVQTYEDWNIPAICDFIEPIEVTDGIATDPCENNGGDLDDDGICAIDDCDDGDATIGETGSVCDDGNSDTVNDVLQADCSCAGTEIPQSGCPVVWSISNRVLTIDNIIGTHSNISVFDANLSEIFNCHFDNDECMETESVQLGQDGIYYIQIQLWNGWADKRCEVFEKFRLGTQSKFFGFGVEAQLQQVEVSWTNNTGAENAYFQIEKSTDGINFYDIKKVNSANESAARYYSATDINPIEGFNYYRIKLTNLDGSVEYSEIKKVRVDNIESFGLFPNPAEEVVHVSLDSYQNKNIEIQLINQFGQRLNIDKILNNQQRYHTVNLSKLNNGIYTIWVFAEGNQPVGKRLIVNRMY